MKVLGLDISTTATGYSVLDFTHKRKPLLLECNYYTPLEKFRPRLLKDLEKTEFLEMLSMAEEFASALFTTHRPDLIAIEDYIRYLGGGSSSGSVIPLAILNQTLALSAYRYTQTHPITELQLCNVMSIRHAIKKASKLSDLPAKENLPPLLEKLLKVKLPVFYAGKKLAKIASETYDCSDSVAVAWYAYQDFQRRAQ